MYAKDISKNVFACDKHKCFMKEICEILGQSDKHTAFVEKFKMFVKQCRIHWSTDSVGHFV